MRRATIGHLARTFLASSSFGTETTRQWYAGFLRTLVIHCGEKAAEDLTADNAREWVARYYGKRSQNTQLGAGKALVRLMHFAVAERLISHYPLAKFVKASPTHREQLLSPAQYALCLKACRSRQLRDVIRFLWHTGCRPQEMRAIHASYVRESTIVLPQMKSKGRRKRRIIFLDDTALAIISRRMASNPTGPLFIGPSGKAWTKNGIVLAFSAMQKKTNIPGLCAYAFRHAYVTRLLERGVDVTSVATIAGTSVAMITETYQHVNVNEGRLLRLVGNVGGSPANRPPEDQPNGDIEEVA